MHKKLNLEAFASAVHATVAEQTAMPNLAEQLALEKLAEAARLQPNNPAPFYHLGTLQCNLGFFDDAAASIRSGLRLDPANASAHNFLGIALGRQGQRDQAMVCFRQALQLDPNYADAYSNLAIALVEEANFSAADECFRQALRFDPSNRRTIWNHALLRLLQGDFPGGWPGYEERWVEPGKVKRDFSQPRWDGTPLTGKTIFVYAEQGFGDTLQCIRYLPLVPARGDKVIFESQPALVPLLKELAGADRIIPAGQAPPAFDVQIPLLSLPGVLGTTMSTIPAAVPYVKADAARNETWRRELSSRAGFKVGISWQANPTFRDDRTRSFPLRLFEKLAAVPGVTLVSLQKGPGEDQLKEWAGSRPVVTFGERLDKDAAFVDTAAIMNNLDLIVTVDSAVAHLAGALGRPVWTLLRFVPDWRWLLNRSDSPWYPTMRLFRQARPGDWDDVFDRVAATLSVV